MEEEYAQTRGRVPRKRQRPENFLPPGRGRRMNPLALRVDGETVAVSLDEIDDQPDNPNQEEDG
jgi:hypothetical protein